MTRNRDFGSKQDTVAELQAELGAQLRRERISQRLEQQALAARAGVARAAVSRVENGQGGTIGTLLAIVRALGRDDWLAGFAPLVAVAPMDLITRARGAPQRVRRTKHEAGNA